MTGSVAAVDRHWEHRWRFLEPSHTSRRTLRAGFAADLLIVLRPSQLLGSLTCKSLARSGPSAG